MATVAVDPRPKPGGETAAGNRTKERVLAVTDAVGAFIETWGFKSIHGRVWALLALRRRPMAQAEMAEMLGVSRALVSLAVAELVDRGLVVRSGEGRNAPYEARLDAWPTITDVLREREWMLMERARVALEALVDEAEFAGESGVELDYDIKRIRILLAMTEFAQTALRAIISVRIPRSLDSLADWFNGSSKLVRKLGRTLRR